MGRAGAWEDVRVYAQSPPRFRDRRDSAPAFGAVVRRTRFGCDAGRRRREDILCVLNNLIVLWCVPKGAITSWVKVPPGQWSVGPVAGRRFGWATGWIEALR